MVLASARVADSGGTFSWLSCCLRSERPWPASLRRGWASSCVRQSISSLDRQAYPTKSLKGKEHACLKRPKAGLGEPAFVREKQGRGPAQPQERGTGESASGVRPRFSRPGGLTNQTGARRTGPLWQLQVYAALLRRAQVAIGATSCGLRSDAALRSKRTIDDVAYTCKRCQCIGLNDRGNKYALAAFRDNRGSIASEIVQTERKLRHLRETLVHVDATLRL